MIDKSELFQQKINFFIFFLSEMQKRSIFSQLLHWIEHVNGMIW